MAICSFFPAGKNEQRHTGRPSFRAGIGVVFFDQGIARTTTDPPVRVRVVVVAALRCMKLFLTRGVFAGNGVLAARGLTAPDPLAKTET